MVPDSLILLLSNVGVAGIFCALFVIGAVYPRSVVHDLKEENRILREAIQQERDRNAAMVAAAQSTRDVVSAIQAGLEMARHDQQ